MKELILTFVPTSGTPCQSTNRPASGSENENRRAVVVHGTGKAVLISKLVQARIRLVILKKMNIFPCLKKLASLAGLKQVRSLLLCEVLSSF